MSSPGNAIGMHSVLNTFPVSSEEERDAYISAFLVHDFRLLFLFISLTFYRLLSLHLTSFDSNSNLPNSNYA